MRYSSVGIYFDCNKYKVKKYFFFFMETNISSLFVYTVQVFIFTQLKKLNDQNTNHTILAFHACEID